MQYGHFESFDLSINLGPNSIPWISASSRAGAVHGIPRHSASLPPLSELLDMVHDYTYDVQFAEEQADPQLSRILGELIFGDAAVLQLFQATRGVAADRGRQVLFRILASAHLSPLPWELLPDPAAGRHEQFPYLALAPDTHVIRQARGRTYPMRTALLEAPLNLLLVLSSPTPGAYEDDSMSFDIFEIKRNLLAELSILQRKGLLHVEVVDRPTADNLRRKIGAQSRGYHLFHYVGHALPEGLMLEDRAGYREIMPAADLAELLQLCPDLRLAVFAGCETARAPIDPLTIDVTTRGRDLLSLADYCVQEACPAVIGMQAVLPFSTERIFTRFFYQAVASGYSIAESLRLARGAIRADRRVGGDLLDWSVPTLFVGADEPGPIVPRTPPTPPKESPRRMELNLGLRQRNLQFFGRDLPLRQAIDVIAGQTPERVLVVTGANGIGKTSLIDRALEEIGDTASHSLFVTFDRLAPGIDQAYRMFASGNMPDPQKLASLIEGSALEKLCILTHELLTYSGVQARVRDQKWEISEWWDRLVEDMIRRKFVLVIDGVGILDHLQRELLAKLMNQVLTEYVDTSIREKTKPQVLLLGLIKQRTKLQEVEPDKDTLADLWRELPIPEQLLSGFEKLPERHRLECVGMYLKSLEQLLSSETLDLSAPKSNDKLESSADILQGLYKAHETAENIRSSVGKALGVLADRRSPVRIVVVTSAPPRDFFNLPDNMIFQMRLAPLTWTETWRWIRRNLPGLLRFDEESLSHLWGRFGINLELWEEFERLLSKQKDKDIDLLNLARQITPPQASSATQKLGQAAQRSHRALRIAVAGPFVAATIADSITQLARRYNMGGRVVLNPTDLGALATLIDLPSPFANKFNLDAKEITDWLNKVIDLQADIILLDYASGQVTLKELRKLKTAEYNLLRSCQQSALLIAAGGHKPMNAEPGPKRGPIKVTTPAAFPEVLSVGALDDEGKIRPYSEWNSRLMKPDIFMSDDLAGTPMASGLRLQDPNMPLLGSGFSAVHAVATAALVWSLLPEYPPKKVRKLLEDAAEPMPRTKARRLTMDAAINLARRRLVEEALQEGPASLQTLSAITGLEGRILSSILEQDGLAVRLSGGRLERFQLAPRGQ